jgi:Spy/CpxP family protein refolding chaperone
MKTTMTKFAFALAVAGGVALSAAAASLAGATASSAQPRWQSQCIPQYDSSGAQVAPYC